MEIFVLITLCLFILLSLFVILADLDEYGLTSYSLVGIALVICGVLAIVFQAAAL
jgi:hypothetical protein